MPFGQVHQVRAVQQPGRCLQRLRLHGAGIIASSSYIAPIQAPVHVFPMLFLGTEPLVARRFRGFLKGFLIVFDRVFVGPGVPHEGPGASQGAGGQGAPGGGGMPE